MWRPWRVPSPRVRRGLGNLEPCELPYSRSKVVIAPLSGAQPISAGQLTVSSVEVNWQNANDAGQFTRHEVHKSTSSSFTPS